MEAVTFRAELISRLEKNLDKVLLRIVLSADLEKPVELTGGMILEQARAMARRHAVVDRPGVVLLLLPHSLELFLLHLGLVLEGWLPAILPWPTSRMDPAKYQRNLLHQLRNLPAQQLITLPRLVSNLAAGLPFPATECTVPGCEALERAYEIPLPLENTGDGVEAGPETQPPPDSLFLQFSGGTTGAQKAVVVTAPMMASQMDRLRDALGFDSTDGVASWLPMYHDMGLIACLWFPLWHGAASTQISASDWLLAPDLLFSYLDRYQATYCWLPNFAFSYLAGQRGRMNGPYRLGHVRGFVNCSEPVRARSMNAFADTFADWGVRRTAPQASYAMAENVFAVTQTPMGEEPRQTPRSGLSHAAKSYPPLAFDMLDETYVSSGAVLESMEVRIRGMNGDDCADREPGEILIRSEALFSGYWGSQGFLTSSISADGWYSTGDYGFMEAGHLYVIGRLKDIVIVGGQNIFPEDVEAVVNALPGVYPGRVVAFGVADEVNGTEALAVVAEMRGEWEAGAAKRLEREMQQGIMAAIGIAPRYTGAVPERWIVKSTAGKISRRDTRERFLTEKLRRQPK